LIRASFAVSLVAVACLANGSAGAFLVGLAPTCDELVRQADFIGKVTVLDSKPVVDPWFDGVRGYARRDHQEAEIARAFFGAGRFLGR